MKRALSCLLAFALTWTAEALSEEMRRKLWERSLGHSFNGFESPYPCYEGGSRVQDTCYYRTEAFQSCADVCSKYELEVHDDTNAKLGSDEQGGSDELCLRIAVEAGFAPFNMDLFVESDDSAACLTPYDSQAGAITDEGAGCWVHTMDHVNSHYPRYNLFRCASRKTTDTFSFSPALAPWNKKKSHSMSYRICACGDPSNPLQPITKAPRRRDHVVSVQAKPKRITLSVVLAVCGLGLMGFGFYRGYQEHKERHRYRSTHNAPGPSSGSSAGRALSSILPTSNTDGKYH